MAFAATSLCPSLLLLLACALISHRSNNTAALFKLYCTQLSNLQSFQVGGLSRLHCASYTSSRQWYLATSEKEIKIKQ